MYDSLLNKVDALIMQKSTVSEQASEAYGEVFTPKETILEMINLISKATWEDSTSTFFDPVAGRGNFTIYLIKKLNETLSDIIVDDFERLKHIVENQIYLAEYQPKNAEFLNIIFTFGKDFKVNLYVGNTLEMPEDFFDLSWEERREKYPENCIID